MKIRPSLMIPILAILIQSSSIGQDTIKTLFDNSQLHSIGIYAAPDFQYGEIQNTNTSFVGISLMILFNNRLAIGGSVFKNVDPDFSPIAVNPLYLSSFLKTIKMEYTVFPASKIHFSIPIDVGIATINLDSFKQNQNFRHHSFKDNEFNRHKPSLAQSEFKFIQFGINAETNVTKCAKLFLGVNYRTGLHYDSINASGLLSKSDLDGLSIVCGIKVGIFNKKSRCCPKNKCKSQSFPKTIEN